MPFHSRLVVAAAAALALSATARADGATQVKIDGIGAAACSQVMARFDGGGGPFVGEAILQWTYGYLLRRNVERSLASQTTVDLASAMNEDKLLNVIVKTCRDKPDLRVFQVVDAGVRRAFGEGNADVMTSVRVVIVVVVAVVGGFAAAWLYVVADQAQFEPNINLGDRVGAVLTHQYGMDAPGRQEIDRCRGTYEEPTAPLRTAVARVEGLRCGEATGWRRGFHRRVSARGFLGLAISARGEAQTG